MGKARRKTLTMLVTVSVYGGVTAAETRAAVRHELLALPAYLGASRLGVKPAGKIIEAAKRAWAAWGGGPKVRAAPERLPLIDYINGGGEP